MHPCSQKRVALFDVTKESPAQGDCAGLPSSPLRDCLHGDGRPKREHHLLPYLGLSPLSPFLNNTGFSSPLSELESVIDCLACWSPYRFISVIQLCGDFISF